MLGNTRYSNKMDNMRAASIQPFDGIQNPLFLSHVQYNMENMIASSYNRNADPGTQLRQSMRELGDRIDAMVSPVGKSELKKIKFDNNVTIKYKKKPEPSGNKDAKK